MLHDPREADVAGRYGGEEIMVVLPLQRGRWLSDYDGAVAQRGGRLENVQDRSQLVVDCDRSG